MSCPFCGGSITAASIKCRHCQADLPATEQRPPSPAGGEVASAYDTEPLVAGQRLLDPLGTVPDGGDPVVRRLASLCLLLVAVLAVILAALALTVPPGSPARAGDGQVTADGYRQDALRAATRDATTVLSYSYASLAADERAARRVLTPSYARQYAAVMSDAGAKATAARLTQQATVLTAALLSITRGKAVVLLAVRTLTTAADSTRHQLLQNRVKVTLERKDGAWAVSNMVQF
jgi:hypothetical protein